MTKPNVLILHASGTNRDHEAARAIELAGGQAHILHINQLRKQTTALADFQMLLLAGGFSYGDALGAGQRLALDLTVNLAAELRDFVSTGKAVLGICNGFQALVKAGILPEAIPATLSPNQSQRFECRWVMLEPNPASPCIFSKDLAEPIYCPAAHGEGQFISLDKVADKHIALRYRNAKEPALGQYPHNPNGSVADIAGICNAQGNVLGLMPHPEDNILWYQQPLWTRSRQAETTASSGLPLFVAGIRYAAQFAS